MVIEIELVEFGSSHNMYRRIIELFIISVILKWKIIFQNEVFLTIKLNLGQSTPICNILYNELWQE